MSDFIKSDKGQYRKLLVLISGLAMICLLFSLMSCSSGDEKTDEELYKRTVLGNTFDTAPVRGEMKPLLLRRSSFQYKCSECHKDFSSMKRREDLKGEHSNIDFDHGSNLNCLNCHHQKNRNVYVDQFGGEIPSTQPARLCAKCHGPIHRDWVAGVHGRQNGYWDVSKGERTKLLCIQCHDPHRPKFQLMKPDPAPDYSRLEPDHKEVH
jgi:hypothetical protein